MQNVARLEFTAHGAAAQGPDTGSVYSQPEAVCRLKTEKPGKLLALSYCNIHGLWSGSLDLG